MGTSRLGPETQTGVTHNGMWVTLHSLGDFGGSQYPAGDMRPPGSCPHMESSCPNSSHMPGSLWGATEGRCLQAQGTLEAQTP